MWRIFSGGGWAAFVFLALVSLPSARAAGALDAAKADHDAGRLQSAVIRLKTLLQEDPGNGAARLALAGVYVDLANGAAAEQEVDRARAASDASMSGLLSTWADALLLRARYRRLLSEIRVEDARDPQERAVVQAQRGEALLALDEAEEAGVAFAKALELDPGLGRPHVGMARIALPNQGRDAAVAVLQRALETAPRSAEVFAMLGDVELGRGNPGEAEQAFTESIRYARNKWLRHYQRALARIELQDLGGAREDIDATVKQNKRTPLLHYVRGRLAFANGDWEEAAGELNGFLNAKPDAYRAMYFAGLALLKLERPQQAEDYLSRMVAANPDSVQGVELLATSRLQAGDPDGAIEALTPYVDQDDPAPAVLALMFDALSQAGRYEEANAAFEQLTKGRSDLTLDMRLAGAAALLNAGRTDEAMRALEALVRDEPAVAAPRRALCGAFLKAGDFARALVEADELVKLFPEEPQSHLFRAVALMGQEDFDEAQRSLDQVLKLAPDDLGAVLAMARLNHDRGDLDAARAVLEDGLARHPDSEQILLALAALDVKRHGGAARVAALEEILAKSSGSAALHLRLASAYLDAGEPERVLALFQAAPEAVRGRPEALRLLARAQAATENVFAAVATFEKLVADEPGSAQNWYLLAEAFAQVGNVSAMLESVDRALELDSNHPMTFSTLSAVHAFLPDQTAKDQAMERWMELAASSRYLGMMQAQHASDRGDFSKALEIYRNLRTLAPNDRVLLVAQMRAQQRIGRAFAVVATAMDWLKTHPDDVEVRTAMAQALERQGKQAAAIDVYRRALETDPSTLIALNNLAMLLREQDPEAALKYAQKAHSLRPDDANIADTLGSVLIAQGKAGEALPYLEAAYAGMPANPSVAYRLAVALAGAGDEARARSVLLTVGSRMFPEQKQAQELLDRLSK